MSLEPAAELTSNPTFGPQLYVGRGGFRIGKGYLAAWNFPFPSATIHIHRDGIIVRYPFKNELQLPRANISAVEIKRRLIFKVISLRHNRPDLPPYILFLSFDLARLDAALLAAGYL